MVVAVDPDGSSLEGVSSLDRSRDVTREDSSGETVHRVVGDGENIGFVLELGNDDDGSENLFLDDPHVGLDVGEDGRLDKVSLSSVPRSSGVDSSSLLDSGLDVSHDTVVLELRSLGSLESVGGEGVSDLEGGDLLGQEVEEFVVDTFLDVDSRSGATTLSVVEEESERGTRGK